MSDATLQYYCGQITRINLTCQSSFCKWVPSLICWAFGKNSQKQKEPANITILLNVMLFCRLKSPLRPRVSTSLGSDRKTTKSFSGTKWCGLMCVKLLCRLTILLVFFERQFIIWIAGARHCPKFNKLQKSFEVNESNNIHFSVQLLCKVFSLK